MQSAPITTKVVSLNPAHGKVYSIQNHVITKMIFKLLQLSLSAAYMFLDLF
jgi:hypothetical protein